MKITVHESINESTELSEESVLDLLDSLNLVVDNKWYDGNKSRPVFDCKDKFDELGETVCVLVEPPYEARVWFKDLNPRVNHYTEGIETIEELKDVLKEFFKLDNNESKKHKVENYNDKTQFCIVRDAVHTNKLYIDAHSVEEASRIAIESCKQPVVKVTCSAAVTPDGTEYDPEYIEGDWKQL